MRFLGKLVLVSVGILFLNSTVVYGAEEKPNALVERLTSSVLDEINSDKELLNGDLNKIKLLVDRKIIPYVNFQRMTASAVGPAWRQATLQQKEKLQEQFKTLLVRSYAGALNQIKNKSIRVLPLRSASDDTDVLVQALIIGGPEPIKLGYRLEKTPNEGVGWKIYNLNVFGVWLVETYRTQFSQVINAKGVDGLIETLTILNSNNKK